MSHRSKPSPYDVAAVVASILTNPWCHEEIVCAWLEPDKFSTIGYRGHTDPLLTLRAAADGTVILRDRKEEPLAIFGDWKAAYEAMCAKRERQKRILDDLLADVLQFGPELILPAGDLSRNEKRVVAGIWQYVNVAEVHPCHPEILVIAYRKQGYVCAQICSRYNYNYEHNMPPSLSFLADREDQERRYGVVGKISNASFHSTLTELVVHFRRHVGLVA